MRTHEDSTPEGYKYFVSMIDDYSKMSAVTLIKQKSDVAQAVADFINMAQTQLSKHVKEFHSDNGGEYMSDKLQAAFKKFGIIHTKSAPGTPQQNSVAERFNRTIIEMATCLMRERGVEEHFWGYAVLYANRIRNRLPCKGADDKVPFALWFNKSPSLKHHRTFGCKALNLVTKGNRAKFDSHSTECMYLGPDSDHGIHILYNPNTGKIIRSRDVEFIEDESLTQTAKADDSMEYEYDTNSDTNTNSQPKVDTKEQDSNNQTKPEGSSDDEDLPYEHPSDLNNSEDYCRNITDELNYNPNYIQTKSSAPKNQDQLNTRMRQHQDYNRLSSHTKQLIERLNKSKVYNDELNANFISETSRANAPMEHAFATISGPSSYKQAMMQSDKHQWESAIDEELRSMEKNQVWEVVDTPSNKNIVTSRWVFVKKTDEHGNLERYKARLVARGFQQIPGQDFNETFAPVVRFTSIRVVLAIAAKYKMHIHQMDVKTAFLNGFLDEDIYMAIPEGVTVNNADSKCLKLKKSIYGLKQSPLSWNKVLDEFLLSNQMIRSTADSGVYMRKIQDLRIFVTTYVDDLLIASQNMALISEFKKKLESRFEMSDLGPLKYILGIQVTQSEGQITINQEHYIDELVQKFNMPDCKGYNTPMEVGAKLVKATDSDTITSAPYASLIGSLLYVSNCTRPDITYAVNRLSSFNANPTNTHWKAAKRVLRYLKDTKTKNLVYGKNNDDVLHGYCDSDWGSNTDERRSTTGYIFFLNGNAISWNSKRQKTVAASTAEAEYMSLFEASRELIWLEYLLSDLGETPETKKISCDNQSAIELAKNPVHHQRSKHIDIKYHFIREKVKDEVFELVYHPSQEMIADVLTKSLPFATFSKLISKMNLA